MKQVSRRRSWWCVLFGAAPAAIVFQAVGASQNLQNDVQTLTYLRGQSVVPLYHGWQKNADGSMDLHFGYTNRNWQEEPDIPVGPNNNVSPAPFGPDAGQPTHFLPRANRWQLRVRVPADFEQSKREIVWTLTSHGETLQAVSNFHAAFYQDEFGIQREFYGTNPALGNQVPEVKAERTQLTAKVGEPVELAAVATDDGLGPSSGSAVPSVTPGAMRPLAVARSVAGGNNRNQPSGLRFAWYVFRGAGKVRFNPPQFHVWEDVRAGANSPYSPGWAVPPIPPGNRWVAQAIFSEPGTFVIRALAHDGIANAYENVTVTVTE